MTVEAQSYGPESIKGIRVVEHIPAGALQQMQVPPVPDNNRPVPAKTSTPQKMQSAQPVRRSFATPASQPQGTYTSHSIVLLSC